MFDMSTLSNVEEGRFEGIPRSAKSAPDALPEARNIKAGVPVRHVPDKSKRWFVFRASYGREDNESDYLTEYGTYTYIAKNYVCKLVNNKKKRILESLVPNILFVYTTPEKALEYVKNTPQLSYLSFYYNHFETDGNQKNPPLIVPSEEMENFILATCSGNEHIMFVSKEQGRFKGGETVRVIDGMFKGVEGRVARVSGQQRVIVSVTNIGLITTAYVPTAFLRVINEPL